MNEQQNDNINSNRKLEKLIKLLSVLLVFFCLLSVFLLVKMYKMDNTLNRLSYIIGNETEEYENKDIIDVFVEESEIPESLFPLYDEISSQQNEEQNDVRENETTNNKDTTNSVTNKSETNSNDETDSYPVEDATNSTDNSEKITYVINNNSRKMHYSDCSFVNRMKEENKQVLKLSKSELKNHLNNGYTFCSTCGG